MAVCKHKTCYTSGLSSNPSEKSQVKTEAWTRLMSFALNCIWPNGWSWNFRRLIGRFVCAKWP